MHPLSALEIFLFRAGTRKVLGWIFCAMLTPLVPDKEKRVSYPRVEDSVFYAMILYKCLSTNDTLTYRSIALYNENSMQIL